jgi:hypothetical protein
MGQNNANIIKYHTIYLNHEASNSVGIVTNVSKTHEALSS